MGKRKRVLSDVFADPAGPGAIPVKSNIAWHDIVSMLKSHGAEISPGHGSRVRVHLNGVRAVFHRPHPEKEAGKGMVKSLRRFLQEAGVLP